MIKRTIEAKLRQMTTKFPVVTLSGTRQCGKSTLLKHSFKDYKYISLEDLDRRQLAIDDPRGFLMNFGTPLIIDEAQYAPNLFSYIQTAVDDTNGDGMYILSGSYYVVFMLQPYYKNYNKRLVKSPKLYFYDTGLIASLLGLEEHGATLNCYEIKSSATMHTEHFKSLKSFAKNDGLDITRLHVVYGGDEDVQTSNGNYISWKNL